MCPRSHRILFVGLLGFYVLLSCAFVSNISFQKALMVLAVYRVFLESWSGYKLSRSIPYVCSTRGVTLAKFLARGVVL